MWHSVIDFIYSPIMLQMLATHSENLPLSKHSLNRTCPSDGLTPTIFYNHKDPNLRGCHPVNFQGPCGENMILYSTKEDEKIGECDCDRRSPRTLIYHRRTAKCYPIFQQGYCSSGKWLDLTENGMPTCKTNPCIEKGKKGMNHQKGEELVLMKGECVKLDSPSSLCDGLCEKVGFNYTRRLPTCVPACRIKTIGAVEIKCRPGTYRAITGRCQPEFEFEWD